MSNNIKSINGSHNIKEICDSAFMKKYTRFSSFEEMYNYSGFTQEFSDIPQEERDYFVTETTKFKNREAMLETAGKEFVMKKLIG